MSLDSTFADFKRDAKYKSETTLCFPFHTCILTDFLAVSNFVHFRVPGCQWFATFFSLVLKFTLVSRKYLHILRPFNPAKTCHKNTPERMPVYWSHNSELTPQSQQTELHTSLHEVDILRWRNLPNNQVWQSKADSVVTIVIGLLWKIVEWAQHVLVQYSTFWCANWNHKSMYIRWPWRRSLWTALSQQQKNIQRFWTIQQIAPNPNHIYLQIMNMKRIKFQEKGPPPLAKLLHNRKQNSPLSCPNWMVL